MNILIPREVTRPIMLSDNCILNTVVIEEFENSLHMQFERENGRLKRFITQSMAQPIDGKDFMTSFNKPRNDLSSTNSATRRNLYLSPYKQPTWITMEEDNWVSWRQCYLSRFLMVY